MAALEFDLIDGLAVGDGDGRVLHRRVKLRSLTAGDLEDAALEAERVLQVGGEPVIVVSPTKMSNAILRRQLLRIGDIAGPLQEVLFRQLTAGDLELIQSEADVMDAASRTAVEAALRRGRSEGPAAEL